MRTKHYKIKGFRLDDKIVKNLEDLKFKYHLSYNLLLKVLISTYEKAKEQEQENNPGPTL